MKPNFALDLSHDGIGLLHRGADGWHSVGSVSLEDPEFTEKLAYLRQTAAALETGGVTTKLVIPNSQIRFITAEAPGPSAQERNEQVRDALVGTTPYPIDELVYDWTVVAGVVHVAAVARETLDEAEGFADEHGFNPVSFVATPNPGTFAKAEPFFGTSTVCEALLDRAVTVEPDANAIRVIGPAIVVPTEVPTNDVPQPANNLETTLALEVDSAVASEPVATAAPKPVRPSEPEIVSKPEVTAKPAPKPEQDTPPVVEPTTVAPPAQKEIPSADKPIAAGITAAQLPDLDAEIPEAQTPAFASRREGKTRTSDDQALQRIEKIESRLAILPDGKTSRPPKLAGATRGVEKPTPEPILRAKPAVTPTEPPVASPVTSAPKPPAAPSKSPKTAAPIAAATPAATVIPPPQPAVPFEFGQTDAPSIPAAPKTEEQSMTVFGARKSPKQNGKPRYLGLTLMAMLVAILGGIVLWSTFFLSDETTVSGHVQDQPETPTDPATTTATNTVGDALAMLTQPSISRGTQTDEILPPTPLEIAVPALPADDPVEPQLTIITPTPTRTTTPLSPQEAQAAYDDTGIWQLAPKPPLPARQDEIDTLYITSVDPQIASLDAIALPTFPASSGDTSLELQTSPAAHSAAFVLDDRGLVIPSANGTLTPDGVMVFAGSPPSRPGIRGDRVPQVVVEPDLTVTGFRPKPRPADLVQQTETVQETEQLGGYTRVQLASFRAKPRPYEIRPPQNDTPPEVEDPVIAEEPDAPAIQPQGPVSELAVVLSSAPKHRPRGFAKLVERSRAAAPTERATAAVAVPRKQTIQPSAPTRASVARLATTKNAINLKRTSLIGIYGSPSKRRALVRLSSGRYVKVKVGERVDGGKVAAIGQSELRYVKGGRTIVLRMPKT